MTNAVPRSVVDAFYNAYAKRDAKEVAQFLDDDVEWTVSGPIDVLSFCGTHRGKKNVVDLIDRLVPEVMRVFSFVPESILIDGDQVAMLNRQSARRADDGRVIKFPGGELSAFPRRQGGRKPIADRQLRRRRAGPRSSPCHA
jgi:ketosteroid isomerase-like protein